MTKFRIRYSLPVDVTVTVDVDGDPEDLDTEDAAREAAYPMLKEFAGTVWTSMNGVVADAWVDNNEPYEVEAI